MNLDSKFGIIAIDPGFCTGVCRVIIEPVFEMGEVVYAKEYPWDQRFRIPELVKQYPNDVILVESFRVYAHKAKDLIGSDMPSSQVIGMVEYALQQQGRLDQICYQQAVATAKVKIPDNLKAVFGSSEHMKDAYKHIKYWAAFRRNKYIQRKRNK